MHIRGAGYQPKRRRLEPASIEELDVIVENMPEKWKLMVLLASWCALRYGEIAELRRKDIKLRHASGRWTGVIQVRRGVVWVNRKIQVEPPKSEAGIRDVAIPPHLIPVIKERLEKYAALSRRACSSRPPTDASSGPPRSPATSRRPPRSPGARISASTTSATLGP